MINAKPKRKRNKKRWGREENECSIPNTLTHFLLLLAARMNWVCGYPMKCPTRIYLRNFGTHSLIILLTSIWNSKLIKLFFSFTHIKFYLWFSSVKVCWVCTQIWKIDISIASSIEQLNLPTRRLFISLQLIPRLPLARYYDLLVCAEANDNAATIHH